MKGEILKIEQKPSRFGGSFYYLFFKGEDGKSYRTCLSPNYRNWKRWEGTLKVGTVVGGLVVKRPGLIDADSRPVIVGQTK